MYDLQSLREMVEKEGFTCAIAKGEKLFTSTSRGVRPLLDLIESGEDFRGGVAADKIVGKAAALLYAHMGISEVYAGECSPSASLTAPAQIFVRWNAYVKRLPTRLRHILP